MIDVGGTALLAAAARNHAGVAAVSSPASYGDVVADIRQRGSVSAELRQRLAAEAFATVAAHHAEVAAYLNQVTGATFPPHVSIILEKVTDLPYGENPHQRAAFYRETTHRDGTIADAVQLQGRPPTFNDLLDLDAAWLISRDFGAPTAVVVRHTDPVGIASDDGLPEAYRRALETDPAAGYGAIVGVNRQLDGVTASLIAAGTFEAVVAPGYDDAALAALAAASRPRGPPRSPEPGARPARLRDRRARLQADRRRPPRRDAGPHDPGPRPAPRRDPAPPDPRGADRPDVRVACGRPCPLERDRAGRDLAAVGIGAAQVNRQVAVEVALRRAGERARMAVMALDAYFPFPDAIAHAAIAGVTAIIQPGGSRRDEMAIEVADRHHLAMVFTGRRHFRH